MAVVEYCEEQPVVCQPDDGYVKGVGTLDFGLPLYELDEELVEADLLKQLRSVAADHLDQTDGLFRGGNARAPFDSGGFALLFFGREERNSKS